MFVGNICIERHSLENNKSCNSVELQICTQPGNKPPPLKFQFRKIYLLRVDGQQTRASVGKKNT